MNTLRQEFCDEINTPMGLDNEFDYIRWLEAKIQALRIHNVVQQSEQLEAFNEVFQIAWELVREESDYIRLLKIKESL